MILGPIVALYRAFERRQVGAETVTFQGAYVKKGQVVELTLLYVVDETTKNKALLVGFQRGEENPNWIEKWIGTAQTQQYGIHMTGRLILVENERPVARVESASANDVIHWGAFGYVYELKE